jgi:hypothetical protein
MGARAVTGALLFAVWLSAQAATPAKPATHQGQTPPSCCVAPTTAQPAVPDVRGTAQSPLAVNVVQLPATPSPVQPAKDRSGWIIAGATVLLAAVTTALAIFTYKLWRSTGALVRGADETAKRELRAYVFLDMSFIRNTATESARPYIVLRNSGKTPAYRLSVSTWGCVAQSCAELPQLPTAITYGHLAPGAPYTLRVPMQSPLTEAQRAAVLAENGNTALYAYGEAQYIDAFKDPHHTHFCVMARGPGALNNCAPLAACPEGNETDDDV